MVHDRPYIFGLQLSFGGDSWGVGDGGVNCFNIEYKKSESESAEAALRVMRETHRILSEAKVGSVADLIGIPVEITFDGSMLKSFRILTEVL
ncbi:MAG TPA: hypothetical protein VGM92_01320 [Candidatus Kapabacteria bacterium]